MSKLSKLIVLLSVVFLSTTLFAQKTYKLMGVVKSADTGEQLIGANVFLKGTTIGAATDANGKYVIEAPAGKYTVVCSFVGFETKEIDINLKNNMQLNFNLTEKQIKFNVTVIADRAKERETPVAFTNVDKKDMEFKLGSRDIPLVLNTTPSVYSTQQGGGAGDARINVRGFNQRNVAIMINGVPVNDMENGWVYWSNWDGVGDATASIQVQRGLSAVNLATPSIGGVINVITSPTSTKPGLTFKQEYGSGKFLKSTFTFNTGLLANKFAFNGLVVRKVGDGIIDKTWTDAWAYYFGASWNINDKNRLELYALGAPQRHGQNLYKQNMAVYSKDFAKEQGYTKEQLDYWTEFGRTFNQNWGPVSSSYTGKQAVEDQTFDRHSKDFINERENFYHKPQINLNYYSQLNKSMTFTNVLYYSGGMGGGTGTYGKFAPDFSTHPWTWNWDKIIEKQKGDTARTILRNSRNNQWTIGDIAKFNWKINKNLSTTIGIDWRTAEIEHYREVRDLLGGTFFYYTGNEFDTTPKSHEKRLGDKIAYYNTNTVDWLGGFIQTEFTKDKWSAYGTFGYSSIKYSYTDHFHKAKDGSEIKLESNPIYGFQIKGGGMYRITNNGDIYANLGYIQKVPIFDAVIDDRHGVFADNPKNERFLSFELGTNWSLLRNTLTVKANIYNTYWLDRALPRSIETAPNVYDILFITGLNQLHQGVEFEVAYQPSKFYRFDLSGSIGNWKILDDVNGQYRALDSKTGALTTTKYQLALKDLKIGDAPQTQVAVAGTIFPMKGLAARLDVYYYGSYYSDWDPTSRIVLNGGTPDRGQSWKIPDYVLLNFHTSYQLPFNLKGATFKIFAHVFNILDAEYISDAVDNSKYNSYKKDGLNHKADDAEVFFGLPRNFNVGVQIAY